MRFKNNRNYQIFLDVGNEQNYAAEEENRVESHKPNPKSLINKS